MLAGRVLFGFGGESLTVAQSALVSVWFQDKELAFALGINLSIARIGGVINNVLSPIFWTDGHFSLWFGLIVCGVSFFCCVLLTRLDKFVCLCLWPVRLTGKNTWLILFLHRYAERVIAKRNPAVCCFLDGLPCSLGKLMVLFF